MLDSALLSGLSSDTFWDMTFRELRLYYQHKEESAKAEWDKFAYLATYIVNVQVEKKNQVDFHDVHPMRDKSEANKQDQINSRDELDTFLKSLSKPK